MTKTIFIAALLFAFAATAVKAADAIDLQPRYNPGLYSKLDRTIDPDRSIYGLRFGATEKQVLATLGVPNGVIALSDTRKALLYGRSHLFILRGGKFRELRVGDHMVDWETARQMDGNPFFDRSDWVLKPGLRHRMTFEEVQKLLNRAAAPDHRFSYDTQEASVTLNFAGFSEPGSGRSTGYRLHAFSIVGFGN